MSVRLTTPNQIVRGVDFGDQVDVLAHGVELIDCSINPRWKTLYGLKCHQDELGNPYAVKMTGGEIQGAIGKAAVGVSMWLTGVHIHDCGSDGAFFGAGGYGIIDTCQIERLGTIPGLPAGKDAQGRPLHADAVQTWGSRVLKVVNSRIEVPHTYYEDEEGGHGRVANSAVYVESDYGNVSHVIINGNVLDGGLYTVRIRDESKGFRVQNVTMLNNRFGRYRFAPVLLETTAKRKVVDLDAQLATASQLIPGPNAAA